ncbi:TetR/AcrR family transcriptional regulator C-terminal domain-containing protein [Actinoallomurus soli]|uniref:TetR/AcrR family transcriptional regulator C-terminal domain-containing protein n=1 Tax=Actinoallomurus soli TaxID=2952535 RepID=UPI00209223A2|nr:TetR/AcrR family transcriptional regulator C-terminal domain-containing protein [Actinoallomurus soli]MCO5972337.1 TetR/AcrR family transcriptional regulator C-terminal domain-containing protein [Actinoallomurus soli]
MRLTREQVVTGGLDLLDEAGLDKLTMRRLAAALGVQNGATYWHFSSKQALLEAMADRMLEGVTAGLAPDLPWEARVAETAQRLRRALLARRDGARLFAGVFFPLPNALSYGETMAATLRDAGLPLRDAVWAVDALTYFVVGHAAEEQLAAALPDGGRSAVARLVSALDSQRHPALHAAAGDVAAPHPQEHFRFGLELLLTGIRARLDGPVH